MRISEIEIKEIQMFLWKADANGYDYICKSYWRVACRKGYGNDSSDKPSTKVNI